MCIDKTYMQKCFPNMYNIKKVYNKNLDFSFHLYVMKLFCCYQWYSVLYTVDPVTVFVM